MVDFCLTIHLETIILCSGFQLYPANTKHCHHLRRPSNIKPSLFLFLCFLCSFFVLLCKMKKYRSVMIHSGNSNRLPVDSHLSNIYYRTKPKSSISLLIFIFVDYHRYVCYQCVYLVSSVNDVLDDILQNHDGSQNISVRKWILDHNSEYCVHRSKAFSQSKHFISRDYKPIINEGDVKIYFKRFSKNKYVWVQISASTSRGDFNNSTNVTHTQIQLMMMI